MTSHIVTEVHLEGVAVERMGTSEIATDYIKAAGVRSDFVCCVCCVGCVGCVGLRGDSACLCLCVVVAFCAWRRLWVDIVAITSLVCMNRNLRGLATIPSFVLKRFRR